MVSLQDLVCLVYAGAPGDPGVPGPAGSIGPKGEIIEHDSLSLIFFTCLHKEQTSNCSFFLYENAIERRS